MTSFTQSADTIVLTNSNTSTGMGLNSGAFTGVLPTVNPSGASVGSPKYLGFTDNTGQMSIIAGSAGSGAAFKQIGFYSYATAVTGQVVTVAEMVPSAIAPVSVKVTMVGGGGGGAAIQNAQSYRLSTGGGGGAATAVQWFNGLTPSSSFTFTVGVGGTGGTNSATLGIDGAPTLVTFGANTYGANGGPGASFATTPTDLLALMGANGGAASTPSGANTAANFSVRGAPGGYGQGTSTFPVVQGYGGAPAIGGGTNGHLSTTGATLAGGSAQSPGVGGSGTIQQASDATAATAGSGAAGIIIFEIFSAS